MPDNIFRVTTISRMYGQEIQNVFHLLGPSADPLEMSAIADHVAANWIVQIKNRQSAAVVYSTVKVRLLESQFPPFVKTINIPGAWNFDDEISTVLSFILRLRSNEIGKRGRGRMYIAGVLKGWTTNGLVDSDIIVSWNSTIANLMGVYGPGGSGNYRLTICPSKAPFSTREVTSMQVAPTLGVQRRRNIGIGV
ncbi:MAG TPA: hypothetical protein V6C97_27060 [Oculatellaceae cyanobacterium]